MNNINTEETLKITSLTIVIGFAIYGIYSLFQDTNKEIKYKYKYKYSNTDLNNDLNKNNTYKNFLQKYSNDIYEKND